LASLSTTALRAIAHANEAAVNAWDAGDTEFMQSREQMQAVLDIARDLLAQRTASPSLRLYLAGTGNGTRAMQRLIAPWLPQRPRLSGAAG
jgi:hypothetical protein